MYIYIYIYLWLFLLLFSCSALSACNPMDCNTSGFPVLHYLPELAQTHAHWFSDAIQPSHPLSSPSPPIFNLSQYQGLFQWLSFFALGSQSIGASVSASVLPMSFQDWLPLGLTGLISCCPRDSQGSSPAPQFKGFNSLVLSHFYCLAFISVHDQWKNHSFD